MYFYKIFLRLREIEHPEGLVVVISLDDGACLWGQASITPLSSPHISLHASLPSGGGDANLLSLSSTTFNYLDLTPVLVEWREGERETVPEFPIDLFPE